MSVSGTTSKPGAVDVGKVNVVPASSNADCEMGEPGRQLSASVKYIESWMSEWKRWRKGVQEGSGSGRIL